MKYFNEYECDKIRQQQIDKIRETFGDEFVDKHEFTDQDIFLLSQVEKMNDKASIDLTNELKKSKDYRHLVDEDIEKEFKNMQQFGMEN